MSRPLRVLSEAEASLESFHDCHVHGFQWRRDRFSFAMNLQYILEWIAPADGASSYRFSVCEARLTFRSVNELIISMDWKNSALDAEISTVRSTATRTTPNGQLERYFEIEFADPDAIVTLWSMGYEVTLLQEPVISELQSIPVSDDLR